ncbi:MAG: GNAT family N-acetyltransferase [Pirellulaceae bacterium]
MSTIQIRRLRPDDVADVAALLEQLARTSITGEFSPLAQEKFLRSNDAAAIHGFIANGFQYWVAESNQAIIGFVGIRDNSHLYHLFVAKSFQRQGIAHQLWQVAQEACQAAGNPGRYTVNSSNNAVGFYESLGFRRSHPMQDSDGVLYNPMIMETAT